MNSHHSLLEEIKQHQLLRQKIKDRISIVKYQCETLEDNVQSLFMLAPSDWGCVQNFGRRGAHLGPSVLMTQLEKWSNFQINDRVLGSIEVTDLLSDQVNFVQSLNMQSDRIFQCLLKSPSSKKIHLGGGHDHIYALLTALSKLHHQHGKHGARPKKFLIVNFDPHLDTRTDEFPNSGNPFRLFFEKFLPSLLSDKTQNEAQNVQTWDLLQVGTLPYANGGLNYSPLKIGNSSHSMQVLPLSEIQHSPSLSHFLTGLIKNPNDYDELILSIDADVLNAASMKAVSAVNPNGVSPERLISWCHDVMKLFPKANKTFGVYEFNPMFDDVSNSSAKTLLNIIYQVILTKGV